MNSTSWFFRLIKMLGQKIRKVDFEIVFMTIVAIFSILALIAGVILLIFVTIGFLQH